MVDETNLIATGVTSLLSGGGGVGIAALLLKAWMRDREQKIAALDTRVTTLQDTTITEIKAEMRVMKANCGLHQDKSAVVRLQATVESLQSSAAKLDESATDIGKKVSGITERIDGIKSWVHDVSTEERKVADELHSHVANSSLHGAK